MEDGNVSIPLKEYRELIEKAEMHGVLAGRIGAFGAYVQTQKYSIDREVCSAIFDFPIENEETGEKS